MPLARYLAADRGVVDVDCGDVGVNKRCCVAPCRWSVARVPGDPEIAAQVFPMRVQSAEVEERGVTSEDVAGLQHDNTSVNRFLRSNELHRPQRIYHVVPFGDYASLTILAPHASQASHTTQAESSAWSLAAHAGPRGSETTT